MGFCSLPPLPSAAGAALTSALLVGAGEAALGKMQGKKKYTGGVWVVGWHLYPLPSAYEPPQLVSSAAGCRASLQLWWSQGCFTKSTCRFQVSPQRAMQLSCPVLPAGLWGSYLLSSLSWTVLHLAAKIPPPHPRHRSPRGPALFNVFLATWRSSGRLPKALYKCSAGKYLRSGV